MSDLNSRSRRNAAGAEDRPGPARERGRGETARRPAEGNGRHEVDHERIEAAVREILLAIGEDPDREGLRDTPARVARMYAELFSGLHCDPREFLSKSFTQKYDEVVI